MANPFPGVLASAEEPGPSSCFKNDLHVLVAPSPSNMVDESQVADEPEIRAQLYAIDVVRPETFRCIHKKDLVDRIHELGHRRVHCLQQVSAIVFGDLFGCARELHGEVELL